MVSLKRTNSSDSTVTGRAKGSPLDELLEEEDDELLDELEELEEELLELEDDELELLDELDNSFSSGP